MLVRLFPYKKYLVSRFFTVIFQTLDSAKSNEEVPCSMVGISLTSHCRSETRTQADDLLVYGQTRYRSGGWKCHKIRNEGGRRQEEDEEDEEDAQSRTFLSDFDSFLLGVCWEEQEEVKLSGVQQITGTDRLNVCVCLSYHSDGYFVLTWPTSVDHHDIMSE